MLHGVSRIPEEPLVNHIERVRTERGLTRRELADAVGVHYQTVGYLERGEYSPSLVLAFRISEVLHTPLEDLFELPATTERTLS
jgi:DNA-binding XRE family transcriptional regulator